MKLLTESMEHWVFTEDEIVEWWHLLFLTKYF